MVAEVVVTRKGRAARRTRGPEPGDPSLAGVIRLPVHVDSGACFEVAPGCGFPDFDGTASRSINKSAVLGLLAAARRGPVRLFLVPGAVLDSLRLRFSGSLQRDLLAETGALVRGECWTLHLPSAEA